MTAEIAIAILAVFVLSLVLTAKVRAAALAQGILDVPNERSSHQTPTPRAGGVAIVVATTLAVVAFAFLGTVSVELAAAVAGGGALVAIVGFVDDRKALSARVRLAVHGIAALWALLWLDGLPALGAGEQSAWGLALEYSLGVLGIVWTLNLFNFMDGIDGIAASEAAFVSCAGALLVLLTGGSIATPAIALVLAAACLGFLRWNWPPARIFMGDVGSGYLGYVIAVLSIAASNESSAMLPAWLILGGVFVVDATVTLVRRVLRGERPHEAHRTHAYQWLTRRWGSHRRVTVAVLILDSFWLLPCALAAIVWADLAWFIVLPAFLPLVVLAIVAGAGRAEPVPRKE